MRGLYGTGHGKDGEYHGLQPRHARLAVASAVAFIDFVSETHRYREHSESDEKHSGSSC
ncbi:MAG: abortive infection family protein [Pseudomonas sp.]